MKKNYYELRQYNNVILFDGLCNLCNVSVDFIIARERGNNLHFASLQSALGKSALEGMSEDTRLDSIFFCKDGRIFSESEAVLQICYFMKRPWRWLIIFRIIPLKQRDKVYQWVSRNRYKWFGKRDVCRTTNLVENEKILSKFIS
jgi:predicted DCC family thiol-disulfide oxidoreductase YuxK